MLDESVLSVQQRNQEYGRGRGWRLNHHKSQGRFAVNVGFELKILVQGPRSLCHPGRVFSASRPAFWFHDGGHWGPCKLNDLYETYNQAFLLRDSDLFCNTPFSAVLHANHASWVFFEVSLEELNYKKLPSITSFTIHICLTPEARLFHCANSSLY